MKRLAWFSAVTLASSALGAGMACGGVDDDPFSTASSSGTVATTGTGAGGNTSSTTGTATGTGTGGAGVGGSTTSTTTTGQGGGIPAGCGDGSVDLAAGEECDDQNNAPGDGCSPSCKIEAAPTCGDGNLDLVNDEECDDSNNVAGDGCSPSCQFELVGATCGDGSIDAAEKCDDSNSANGDSCNPTCNFTNTTTLFAGSQGQIGSADGIGSAARFGKVGNPNITTATMAVDATRLYVADAGNASVRMVNIATALVTTIAGNGQSGYLDSPTGLLAQFGGIEGITTDGTTIWVGDGPNHRIRAISTTPPYAVTTVAGSGALGHVDGNGTAAQFDGLRALTYFNGYVYLLTADSATLRRFDPATGDVITLAGSPGNPGYVDGLGPAARFISPRYMASDGSGILYIADTNGNRMRAYNTVTTEVTTFAGSGACGYLDGVGTAAEVHRPRGMTSDGTSIYWVEANAHTVRQAVAATQSVTTMLGTPLACAVTCTCPNPSPAGSYAEGVGSAALFSNPFSIVYHHPSQSLFVYDSGNVVIRRVQ